MKRVAVELICFSAVEPNGLPSQVSAVDLVPDPKNLIETFGV